MAKTRQTVINPEILVTARKGRRLPQSALAEQIAVGKAQICHIETGRTDPSLKAFAQLIHALGLGHVPVSEFFRPDFFQEKV